MLGRGGVRHVRRDESDPEDVLLRNCCGRGWDLVKCRPIKYAKGRKLKSWSWFRYSEELWNLLTYKLV